eukprot:6179347-Pleurochrysis_carterae.AAC.1
MLVETRFLMAEKLLGDVCRRTSPPCWCQFLSLFEIRPLSGAAHGQSPVQKIASSHVLTRASRPARAASSSLGEAASFCLPCSLPCSHRRRPAARQVTADHHDAPCAPRNACCVVTAYCNAYLE